MNIIEKTIYFWRTWFAPKQRSQPKYYAQEYLHRRRIYVFPTRNGFWFGIILWVMLFGAMNYNNSMAFMMTFLLSGMALVSILYTYRNLAGLRISAGLTEPVFAGDTAHFALRFDNQGQLARIALQLRLHDSSANLGEVATITDIPDASLHTVYLACPATRRGILRLPELLLTSVYPLGLICAWTYLNLDLHCLIYPAPQGTQPLPVGGDHEHCEGSRDGVGGEDFVGYRDYHLGDSPRHVDWKIVAKDQGWLVKQFGGQNLGNVWLSWSEVYDQRDWEKILSQLCRWVIDAENAGVQYGLRLPDLEIAPGWGEQHRVRCLQALALFGAAP